MKLEVGYTHGAANAAAWIPVGDDLSDDGSSALVSVDGHNGNKWVEEATYRDGHWWSERTDGYGEPMKICEYGQVTAVTPLPKPYEALNKTEA